MSAAERAREDSQTRRACEQNTREGGSTSPVPYTVAGFTRRRPNHGRSRADVGRFLSVKGLHTSMSDSGDRQTREGEVEETSGAVGCARVATG